MSKGDAGVRPHTTIEFAGIHLSRDALVVSEGAFHAPHVRVPSTTRLWCVERTLQNYKTVPRYDGQR